MNRRCSSNQGRVCSNLAAIKYKFSDIANLVDLRFSNASLTKSVIHARSSMCLFISSQSLGVARTYLKGVEMLEKAVTNFLAAML